MIAWVARDKSGLLTLFMFKPRKGRNWWWSDIAAFIVIDDSDLPPNTNPQWSDAEPTEVVIILGKKEVDCKCRTLYE